MLRASQCFRIKLLQSGGPRALSAFAPFVYSIPSPSEQIFASSGQSSSHIADRSHSFLNQSVIRYQFIFGPGLFGVGRPII